MRICRFGEGRKKLSSQTSCRACAILVPNQELKLCPLPWKLRVLTTGPPGKLRATFYDTANVYLNMTDGYTDVNSWKNINWYTIRGYYLPSVCYLLVKSFVLPVVNSFPTVTTFISNAVSSWYLFFFLKSLLNLSQYCLCFGFLAPEACGILSPQPGMEPTSPAL